MVDTAVSKRSRPRERSAWVLLPMALVAYGCALLYLCGFLANAGAAIGTIGSPDPVDVTLHASAGLHAASGTHWYSGGPFVADGAAVTATEVSTTVSGLDAPTRLALRLDPTLWSGTVFMVAAAIGLTLARVRARDPRRPASRPLLVAAVALAVGSTAAQAAAAYGSMLLGHVAWMGQNGVDGFTGIGATTFDLTPVAIAGVLLAAVLLARRAERPVDG